MWRYNCTRSTGLVAQEEEDMEGERSEMCGILAVVVRRRGRMVAKLLSPV
jgi:hypothetical protein